MPKCSNILNITLCIHLEGQMLSNKPALQATTLSKDKISTTVPNIKVNQGGWWKPPNCQPRWTIAIIIPFR